MITNNLYSPMGEHLLALDYGPVEYQTQRYASGGFLQCVAYE